ncbi:MAG: hypothetical protein JWM91_873 [Rhodospirillales bacterium]|nr:hypothetical protein [Rhodospirillales bacterium]
MNKITPCLRCDNNVEEMVDLYKSVFPDFEVLSSKRSTITGIASPLTAASPANADGCRMGSVFPGRSSRPF